MMRRQKHKKSSVYLSPLASTLSCTWVPLTLLFLLYTSGLTLGESASEGAKSDSGDEAENKETNATSKKNYTLTGNPQIDYVHDPNLPRELNGYNLSDYPFLNRVPTNLNFSCEGLKDGFYASIVHKCQLYHHCLFGTRYDFLCANYTAFDQKTFICQFVSEIDCPNSALFFHRNDALYVQSSTTPAPRPYRRPGLYDRKRPTKNPDRYEGGSAAAGSKPSDGGQATKLEKDKDPPEALDEGDYDPGVEDESEEDYRVVAAPRRKRCRRRCRDRGRRCVQRCMRRQRPRPADYYYDDYYEDDYYDEGDYYDKRPRRKNKGGRRERNKVAGSRNIESTTSNDGGKTSLSTSPSTTTTVSTTPAPAPSQSQSQQEETLDIEPSILTKNREEIFTQSRPPPRIRPPVPRTERNKYDVMQGRAASDDSGSDSGSSTKPPSRTTEAPKKQPDSKAEYDYYDDDYQTPVEKPTKPTTTTTTPAPAPTTQTAIRQRLFKFGRNTPSTSTTTRGTTTTTLSTTPSTTTTVLTTPRPPPPKATSSSRLAIPTTTTTTESPQYEYEYEYEDELPSSSTEKVTTPTTTKLTTTAATTQKPSRNNFRGKQRPYGSSSSIQTSTSVTVQESELEQPSGKEELDDSQNAINRRLSSWTRSQSQSSRVSPSVATYSTPNSITSTSERFPSSRKQSYHEPVITVKAAAPNPNTNPNPSPSAPSVQQYQTSSRTVTEAPVIKTRPSRFWQRPAKVVASTTTTESPIAEYDYDEPETAPGPVRPYTLPNLRPQKSSLPSSTSSYNSGNSEATYATYNPNPRSPQYSSSSSSSGNDFSSQQYLRPTVNSYRPLAPLQPLPTRTSPVEHNQYSPYGPSPSQMGLGFTSTSSRPEFISLLRDDEDPYYDIQQTQLPNPHHSSRSSSISNSNSNSGSGSGSSRRLPPQRSQYYGSQSPYHHSQKNLYGAAQETFHTFVAPPSSYNQGGFMGEYPPMIFGDGMYSRGNPLLGGKK